MKRLMATLVLLTLLGFGSAAQASAGATAQTSQDAFIYDQTVAEVALLTLPEAAMRGVMETVQSGYREFTNESFSLPAQQQSNAPQVPIPGAVWLLGTGISGLATIRLRSR